MARPRIFVSSTFYDLKHVRAELGRFIREMGYEPVLNERGNVPYGKDSKLEEYCYREIQNVDMLVNIVGNQLGSKSALDADHSISQMELKTARQLGKQIYVFVDRNVYAEYQTYLLNKDVPGVKYKHVSSSSIFKFVEEMHSYQINNQIIAFEHTVEIVDHLREQWAGLFERFLKEAPKREDADLFKELKSSLATVQQLVNFLTEDKNIAHDAVKNLLILEHPLFRALTKAVQIPHRVVFLNIRELERLLRSYEWKEVGPQGWDSPDTMEWIKSVNSGPARLLKIKKFIFDDDGNLKVFPPEQWQHDWVKVEDYFGMEPEDDEEPDRWDDLYEDEPEREPESRP